MIRKRSRGRRGAVGPRRDTDWIPAVFEERDIQTAFNVYALTDEVDLELKDGKFTVERCIGQVLLQKFSQIAPGPTATVANAHVTMGIIVVQEDALGNVTILNPRIQDDLNASWLWIRHLMVGSGTSNGGGGAWSQGFQFNPFVNYDFHVRRKMKERELLALVIVATAWDGSQTGVNDPLFSFDMKAYHRTLVKLN